MKFRYATLAASAVALAFSTAVQAAPTINLTLNYLGSTTATLTTAPPTTGQLQSQRGLVQNPNLTIQNLSDPSVQTTAWKHYFDVVVHFNPDPSSTEALAGLVVNISTGGGATPVSPNGTVGGTSTKYFGYTLTDDNFATGTFTTNADAGTPGDLQAITYLASDPGSSFDALVGQGGPNTISGNGQTGKLLPANAPLGVFGIQLLSSNVAGNPVTLGIVLTTGQNFSYYTDTNGTTVTTGVGATPGSFVIPGIVSTPEPASLGVLALGGLALFARRRRTA